MLRNLSSAGWTANTTFLVITACRERFPQELWAVIPVAEALGQLELAVLEVVHDRPAVARLVDRPALARKIMVHPADAVVHQILLLEVLGHGDRAVVLPRHLPHKLLVVELLPEQDVELRLEPLSDAPLLDEQVLVLSPRRYRLEEVHQFWPRLDEVVSKKRSSWNSPEEIEGAYPVLRQPMQGGVGPNHGEGS